VKGRGLTCELSACHEHPARTHIRQPLLFDGVSTRVRRHVPDLGEHTREILLEAGLAEDAVSSLVAMARDALER